VTVITNESIATGEMRTVGILKGRLQQNIQNISSIFNKYNRHTYNSLFNSEVFESKIFGTEWGNSIEDDDLRIHINVNNRKQDEL